MISLEKIKEHSEHVSILKFSEYVISKLGGNKYPIMKNLDLMDIPGLVNCIWKVAYSEGSDTELRMVFSGSEMDRFWKFNASKVGSVENLYKDKDCAEVMPNFYKESLQKGKVAYSKRVANLADAHGTRTACIEAIFFPCSSDGAKVNSGIGYVDYFTKTKIEKNIFLLL